MITVMFFTSVYLSGRPSAEMLRWEFARDVVLWGTAACVPHPWSTACPRWLWGDLFSCLSSLSLGTASSEVSSLGCIASCETARMCKSWLRDVSCKCLCCPPFWSSSQCVKHGGEIWKMTLIFAKYDKYYICESMLFITHYLCARVLYYTISHQW